MTMGFVQKQFFAGALLCMAFTLAISAAVPAQVKTCSLKLNPVTFIAGTINTNPVDNASLTLTAVKSKKRIKNSAAAPFLFEKLTESAYKLAASKPGFRTTTDTVFVDCSMAVQGVVDRMVIMWEGDPAKTVNYVWVTSSPGSAASNGTGYQIGLTEGPPDPASKQRPVDMQLSASTADAVNTRSETGVIRIVDDALPAEAAPQLVDGFVRKAVINGSALVLAKPKHPPAARAVNASGAVYVQVTIDEDGYVIAAAAVSGHPLLKAVSTLAAKASRFKPTLLSGTPVKVKGIIVYNFL
jgi:hypothetical protein